MRAAADVRSADDELGAALHDLCEWAASRRWDDIPSRVRARARWVLSDDIAAMIAAADEPEVAAYRRLVAARPSTAEAIVIGPGLPRTDRWQAASANGLAASWCELDEGFRSVTCHAGLYVLPALLAEADAERLTLADVLRCLALAYECVVRFATCFRFRTPAVHAHALWAPVGAAAAVALARRYDADALFRAVTAAATLGSLGPRPHLVEGVLVRNAWAAAGAVAGLQCADWAVCGIGGSSASPSAVYHAILGSEQHPPLLVDALGQRWAIEGGYHKLYACCQHGHSAVEAILDALADTPLDETAIETIDIFTHPLALGLDNAAPATGLAAKFSMPHIVAATLVYGSADASSFSPAALRDPRVARLRQRARVVHYEGELAPPWDRPARIVMTLKSGERRVAECRSARGGPDRPLSDGELLDKIERLSASVLPGLGRLARGGDDDDGNRRWSSLLEAMRSPATTA